MRKGNPKARGVMGYLISEDDHLRLVQARNQLQLLASLSALRHPSDGEEPLQVTAASLADCFEQLGRSLALVARNAQWQAG